MKITYVEESSHSVGGYVVKFDSAPDYHWFEGIRKTPRSLQVGQLLNEWLKSNDAIPKADVEKQREKDAAKMQKAQAAAAEKKAKAKEERKQKIIKELEAGNFAPLAEIL